MSLEANSTCHLENALGADCSSAPLSQAIFHQRQTASVLYDLCGPTVYFRLACEVGFFFTFKAVMGLASSCVKRVFFPCHTKTGLDITRCRSTAAWTNHVDAALLLFLHLNSSAASLALTPKFSAWILSCTEGLMWLKTHGKKPSFSWKLPEPGTYCSRVDLGTCDHERKEVREGWDCDSSS